MIGVDIIDLSCSFNPIKYNLETYKSKILNKLEFGFCDSFEDLNCLWSMKESVYKADYKQQGHFFLNPKKITVTEIDYAHASFKAMVKERIYFGSIVKLHNLIYCIASDSKDMLNHLNIYTRKQQTESNIIEEYKVLFGNYTSSMNIHKHPDGFPQGVNINGQSFDYSRSHHGAYYISVFSPVSDN